MADTNTNSIYSRHDGLGIIQEQRVAVIGCGGIGSWIALYLGLAGVAEIDIYDSDTISETNLNRFPLGPDKLHMNKAIAMAEHIQSLRQDVNVIPRRNFDPELHREKLPYYHWVIVSTDSLKSRQLVYNEVVKARETGGTTPGYIEAGADGHHATVTFSPATFATEAENEPGYRSVPVHICPCSLAASIAVYYVLLSHPQDYERLHRVDWAGTLGGLTIGTLNEGDEPLWEPNIDTEETEEVEPTNADYREAANEQEI